MAEISSTPDSAKPKLNVGMPHSARMLNHLLGGKDNYAADRAVVAKILEVFPGMVDLVRHSRAFIGRTVRHLAGEAGIRQFLDIGAGLPTADNTHEIAQRVAPECRIVYVDNDPLVLMHAKALLTSTAEGACGYIDADVRNPGKILQEAARTLDFSQPIALMLMGIMGLVSDYDEARSIVNQLVEALPPGSYLALNDGADIDPAYVAALRPRNTKSGVAPYTPRSPEQIAGYFDGLQLLEPGVVTCSQWRIEAAPFGEPVEVAVFGGVAGKS